MSLRLDEGGRGAEGKVGDDICRVVGPSSTWIIPCISGVFLSQVEMVHKKKVQARWRFTAACLLELKRRGVLGSWVKIDSLSFTPLCLVTTFIHTIK